MSFIVHVAVAVIQNANGAVLIALRSEKSHQGGLWEFPGGKVDQDENIEVALKREIKEELNIDILSARPLIRVPYAYPDKQVLLDVWRVSDYTGTPVGHEGQEIQWVQPGQLSTFSFPAANHPIINALMLPDQYLITPEPSADHEEFLHSLEQTLCAGITLVQLRARTLDESHYRSLAEKAVKLCHQYKARVLLNAEPMLATETGADGVHLNSQRLLALASRPLESGQLVSASCHDASELVHAASLGADFAVLSPILQTQSHPNAEPLGWDKFNELTELVAIPVYALGGMTSAHIEQAWQCGGQGIASMRSLWDLDVE